MSKLTFAKKRNEYLWAYSFIAVPVIGFFVFSLYPLLWVIFTSFTDYDSVSYDFVKLYNYIRLFTRDPEYWKSILNTLIIGFGKLLIELPLALIFAVLFTTKHKGNNFFKIAFYSPSILSSSVVGLVFTFMFSSYSGVINEVLMNTSVISKPINWFGAKWTAMAVIGITSIWQGLGTNILFFSAGLANIPDELYECADIDGANTLHKFFKITLPMLAPVTQVICMLAIIGTIKMTDIVLILTNGGPGGSTEVMMTNVYKAFFGDGDSVMSLIDIGYGSTKGVISSIVVGVITLAYLWVTKKTKDI